MVKGANVSRPSFGKVFSAVNSFHAEVDYTQAHVLGDVREADEKHDGKLILRIKRQLPKGRGLILLCFVHPWQVDMSLGQALYLAMDHGLWPATHHETVVSLKMAVPEQIQELFKQTDMIMCSRGHFSPGLFMSAACLGSAVSGKTGELIPVQEVERGRGWSGSQLRKLDFNSPVPPAMALPFVMKM